MTDVHLTTYKVLGFDRYRTLIDWEAGIGAVFAPNRGKASIARDNVEGWRGQADLLSY